MSLEEAWLFEVDKIFDVPMARPAAEIGDTHFSPLRATRRAPTVAASEDEHLDMLLRSRGRAGSPFPDSHASTDLPLPLLTVPGIAAASPGIRSFHSSALANIRTPTAAPTVFGGPANAVRAVYAAAGSGPATQQQPAEGCTFYFFPSPFVPPAAVVSPEQLRQHVAGRGHGATLLSFLLALRTGNIGFAPAEMLDAPPLPLLSSSFADDDPFAQASSASVLWAAAAAASLPPVGTSDARLRRERCTFTADGRFVVVTVAGDPGAALMACFGNERAAPTATASDDPNGAGKAAPRHGKGNQSHPVTTVASGDDAFLGLDATVSELNPKSRLSATRTPTTEGSPAASSAAVPSGQEDNSGPPVREYDLATLLRSPPANLVPYMSQEVLKPRKVIAGIGALHAFELFVSVTTIMALVSQMTDRYSEQVATEKPDFTSFQSVMNVITYAPVGMLVFFGLIFNNYYAQVLYYHMLSRGIIVDFENTQSAKYFRTHFTTLLFMLVLASYAGGATIVFAYARISWHEIFVFLENVFVGLFLFWYRQQGVEARLVSVSCFVEAFQSATGEYHDIDATALRRAARCLTGLVIAKCDQPSYSNYFRHSWYRLRDYSKPRTAVKVGSIVAVSLLVAFLAFLNFFLTSHPNSLSATDIWKVGIVPCTRVCVTSLAAERAALWGTGGVDYSQLCNACLCRCGATPPTYGFRDFCPRYAPLLNDVCPNAAALCPPKPTKC